MHSGLGEEVRFLLGPPKRVSRLYEKGAELFFDRMTR